MNNAGYLAWKLVNGRKTWMQVLEIYKRFTVSEGGGELHVKPVFGIYIIIMSAR